MCHWIYIGEKGSVASEYCRQTVIMEQERCLSHFSGKRESKRFPVSLYSSEGRLKCFKCVSYTAFPKGSGVHKVPWR